MSPTTLTPVRSATPALTPQAVRRALYADRWVPRYADSLRTVMNRQVRQVAEEAAAGLPTPQDHRVQWTESMIQEKKRWLYAIVLEGYELASQEFPEGGKAASDVSGKAGAVRVGQDAGEFLLRGRFTDIDKWIETTSAAETATMQRKMERIWLKAEQSRDPKTGEAWTPLRISKQIQLEGIERNKARAQMLARTGSVWAMNEGAQQRYRAAGVQYEQWMVTEDDALCPFCNGMNGKIVRIDEPFWTAGSEMGVKGFGPTGATRTLSLPNEIQHPPLHPYCRCTLIPIVDEAQIESTPQPAKPKRPKGVARKAPKAPKAPRPATMARWVRSLTAEQREALKTHWLWKDARDMRRLQLGKSTKRPKTLVRRWVRDMQEAIKTAPRRKGRVYRGLMDVATKDFKRLATSKQISFRGFNSTSRSRKVADTYAAGGFTDRNVMFVINQESGIDMKALARYKSDREVLLPGPLKFQVTKRVPTSLRYRGRNYNVLEIHLKEV